MVVLGGLGARRPDGDPGRLDWSAPPLLRVTEYGVLLWIAAAAGDDGRWAADGALPAAYALLAVLAFRHYDLVYRRRQQQRPPPAWVGAIGGGWDGRLVAAAVAAATGILVPFLVAAAAVLGTVYLVESVVSWMGPGSPAVQAPV